MIPLEQFGRARVSPMHLETSSATPPASAQPPSSVFPSSPSISASSRAAAVYPRRRMWTTTSNSTAGALEEELKHSIQLTEAEIVVERVEMRKNLLD